MHEPTPVVSEVEKKLLEALGMQSLLNRFSELVEENKKLKADVELERMRISSILSKRQKGEDTNVFKLEEDIDEELTL